MDKDWIYGKRGPNPAGQPTVVCDRCREPRNQLSIYATGDGQRWCYTCIRRPVAELVKP